jgi:phospholipid-binding lipoprotein MlaA
VLGAVPGAAGAYDPLFDDDVAGEAPTGPWDPLEPVNREVFQVNAVLDDWFFEPLICAYDFVVPAPARRALRRALRNIDSPAVAVNDLLQGSPIEAMITVTRLGVNSTIGVAGLFDPASALGLPAHETDFGDTLALAGVPNGPYLVLPVVGPTTARDASGYAVDFLFRPTTYVLTPLPLIVWSGITEGGSGIAARDAHAEALQALETSAVDYYAALRNAWWQNAEAEVRARREAPLRLVNLWRELRGGSLAPAGSQVVDPGSQRRDESVEAVALQD